MNVVDSLVVSLGLDSAEFEKRTKVVNELLDKVKDRGEKTSKSLANEGAKAAEYFSKLKIQILGAMAAFGLSTGLKDFIQSNVDGQAALGRLAKNLDMSAKSLDAWSTVAKEMGDDGQASFNALKAVAAGLAQATIDGQSALTREARNNGIILTDTTGKLMKADQAMISISARLSSLPRQQAMVLADRMGVGGIFNELMLGPAELQRRIAHAATLSNITDQSVQASQDILQRWVDFKKKLDGIGEGVFAKIDPVLERLADRLANWLNGINWDKVIEQVTRLVEKVNDVVQAFGGWKTVAEVLAGVLAIKLLVPLISLVGLLGRAAVGVTGLAGSFSGLGSVLAGLDLPAVAAAAAALGLIYSPALGGRKLKDGRYEDETAADAAAKARMQAATSPYQLWNKVEGKPSLYNGSVEQAAMLLAPNAYAGADMDAATLHKQAASILAKRYTRSDDPDAGVGAPKASDGQFSAIEQKHGLPDGFLSRMEQQESGGGKHLLSPKGAMGAFQFMPATAAQLGLSGSDVMDTQKSADAAGRYMEQLVKQFHGNIVEATAAYNWGPGNVAKYGVGAAPKETRDYVHALLGVDIGARSRLASAGGGAAGGATVTSETHIGSITVNTQAKDASGIARDMRKELSKQSLVASTNTGLE